MINELVNKINAPEEESRAAGDEVMIDRTIRAFGFQSKGDQPVGAVDYVLGAGIFRVRVRIPIEGYQVRPQLWVGYSAGGPLIEIPSSVRYRDTRRLVEDAVLLRRILIGH